MSTLQSQQEADAIDKACGVIPIGKYAGNKNKRDYECPICGDLYQAKPNAVRNGNYLCCVQIIKQPPQNKDKQQRILAAGWKLLVIKSDGYDLPTPNRLRKVLFNHFAHGSKRHTITMNSWYKAKRKHEG